MLPSPRRADPNLVALEAVRGIAAIIVVLHHFCLGFLPGVKLWASAGLPAYTLGWLISGDGAVRLFFVLSGFVLALRFFQTNDPGTLLRAGVKRVPRLWPPAAFGVLLGYLTLRFHLYSNIEAAQLTGSRWLASFAFAHETKVFDPEALHAARESVILFLKFKVLTYNTNLWTMSRELYGSYLTFAAAFVLGRAFAPSGTRLFQVLAIFVTLIAAILLPLFAAAFLAGTVLALIYARGPVLPRTAAIAMIGLGLCLAGGGELQSLIGAIFIVAGITTPRSLPAPLAGPFGRHLGRWSFPIYIVHLPVIFTLTSAVFLTATSQGWPFTMVIAVSLAATLIGTAALSLPLLAWEAWYLPKLNRATAALIQR